ncbi:MAG: hypothetical protein IJX25_04855 [Clostridia bacterium]|nr:hypothetical protein [Clostridia bacterium]MBQ8792953.1 hypothetical protein [Clostridia bacterium]
MAKEKSAKSKYLIAIILLVVSICAITGALIGVYAASSHTLSSSFLISYKMNNSIAVKVSAQYQIVGKTVEDLGSVTFDINSTENSGTLGTQDVIILTSGETYVDFTYTFENLSKTQYVQVSSSWANFGSDLSNVICTYQITTDTTGAETQLTTSDTFSQMAMLLPPQKTYSIRVRFEVEAASQNAYVSSSSSTGLTFNLEYVTP